MDELELSAVALYERYEKRIRDHLRRRYFRGLSPEDLLQAARQGLLEARWRYVESSEPPPPIPFERAVWSYICNYVARQAAFERRAPVDDVRHARSLELLGDYHAGPDRHDFVSGLMDLAEQVHAAAVVDLYARPATRAETSPTPEQQAAARLVDERIAGAIGHLPPEQREVIHSHFLEERTFAEIAAARARDESSVRRLCQRALGNLKQTLADLQSSKRMIG